MNKPVVLSPAELAEVLRDMADRVLARDSFEGSIEYYFADAENGAGPEQYSARGAYRYGNQDGQGFMRMLMEFPKSAPQPSPRAVSDREREAAIYLIALDAASGTRGFPSSYPRNVFNTALADALHIAGKVGSVDTVGELDEERMRHVCQTAINLGFDRVRDRKPTAT